MLYTDVMCTCGRCHLPVCCYHIEDGIWGRCFYLLLSMADVIAMWQLDWPPGWIYFNLRSEMFNRTSSHMWGRWYLPMFLLRNGLFTIMYITPLLALIKLWRSTFSADLRKPCWKLAKACLTTKYLLFLEKSGLSSTKNNVTKQKEKP